MSTLVLIPGLAADARMWADQLHGLEASLPVAVAKAHQPCSTITAMAQAVLEQVESVWEEVLQGIRARRCGSQGEKPRAQQNGKGVRKSGKAAWGHYVILFRHRRLNSLAF